MQDLPLQLTRMGKMPYASCCIYSNDDDGEMLLVVMVISWVESICALVQPVVLLSGYSVHLVT